MVRPFVVDAIVVVIVIGVVNAGEAWVVLCCNSWLWLFLSKSQTMSSGLKTVVGGQDITKA